MYPSNEDVADFGENISFVAEQEEDKKVNVRIFFIDLVDYKSSIAELYKKMEECIFKRNIEA